MQHTSKNWRAVCRGTGDAGRVIRACSPTLRTPAHQRLKTVATTARTDRAHIQNNIIRSPPPPPTDGSRNTFDFDLYRFEYYIIISLPTIVQQYVICIKTINNLFSNNTGVLKFSE